MPFITGSRELEGVVGERPLPSMLKAIADLDHHCVDLLALSPIGVMGWVDVAGAARSSVVGGHNGFAEVRTATRLAVPQPIGAEPASGSSISLVFLIPGLGETLRVNGTAEVVGDQVVDVAVREAFAHCAKCVLRSKLWSATAGDVARTAAGSARPVDAQGEPLGATDVADLLARAPFAVITSRDASGMADASPKGDPAGFVQVLDGHRVAIPDRPGNRRTDTFHNIIEQPAVGLLALVPGEYRVVELTGQASLTVDPDLLATMAVAGRVPKLAMVLDVARAWVHDAPVLDQVAMWDLTRRTATAALPNMSQVFVDHVNRNKTEGAAATAVRKAANEPLIRDGLARDYEQNLY